MYIFSDILLSTKELKISKRNCSTIQSFTIVSLEQTAVKVHSCYESYRVVVKCTPNKYNIARNISEVK